MTNNKAKATGKRIWRYRKDAGLTQATLAAKADIPTNTVARLERGEHKASTDTLEKIAKALKVTVTDLLGS